MRLAGKLRSVSRRVALELLRRQVRPETWRDHARYIQACKSLANQPVPQALQDDPIYAASERLRRQAMAFFADRYKAQTGLRVMIHVPSPQSSMGGASLFCNWVDGLRFLGLETAGLPWGSDTTTAIELFRPTVLFTSDHSTYTDQFDWDFIRRYRARAPLALVMTASHEHDRNTPNVVRLEQAQRRGVSFFVSFREPEYIQAWLGEWRERGFEVVSIPFAANPLIYFYVPTTEKPLDYVFLASSNPAKLGRYRQYLLPIFRRYRGVVNGPGWGQDQLILTRDYHRFLYAMAAIGINLHIPVSLEQFSEVNERTYILACCGLFQLTDAPKTLHRLFKPDAIVSADTPSAYREAFDFYLHRPEARLPFILKGMECIYTGHTVFHRMDQFVQKLLSLDELRPVLGIGRQQAEGVSTER